MKAYAIISICLLSGCTTVEYFGAVSMDTYKAHVTEVNDYAKQALENQGEIASVSVQLAQENIIEAKSAGDDAKMERSIESRVKATEAVRRANKLAEVKFERPTTPEFDWGGILQMILSALGISSPLIGGLALMTSKKLTRVKEKAKKYASSPETFDISDDKDLK